MIDVGMPLSGLTQKLCDGRNSTSELEIRCS